MLHRLTLLPLQKLLVGIGIAVIVVVVFVKNPQVGRFLFLGLGSGALISAIALGLVLTYKGSGVVNFANGAVATYAAYFYYGLRTRGEVLVPPLPNPLSLIEGVVHKFGADSFQLPDIPTFVGVGGKWPLVPAIAATVLFSAVLGALLHLLVFGPLHKAPPLAKVIASAGVMLLLQAIIVLRYTGESKIIRPILSHRPLKFSNDIIVPMAHLQLGAIVIVMTGLLWAVFRYTGFGLASRAAAANEKGSVLLGYAPASLARANWILSTTLAGLLGVLVAPVNGAIDPLTLTLLIIPALGAAMLGRFESFGIATAAGLGLGMSQALIQYLSAQSWFPHLGGAPIPGVRDALPFFVIIATLWFRGRSVPTRGTAEENRLPIAPEPVNFARWMLIWSAVSVAALLFLGPSWRLGITNSLIGMIICLSLVVVTGFAGQVSLAQMAFAGLAGFVFATLANDRGWPFPLAPLAAAALIAVVSALVAIPAVRVRGVNLAIVTLAAGLTIENVVFRNPAWTGGLSSVKLVSPPRLLGLKFGPVDPGTFDLIGYSGDGKLPNPWFGVFCLLVAVAFAFMVASLRRSARGIQMLAVRANERAAASAGINVLQTKVISFGVAGFIAGIGGVLSGYRFGSVTPQYFGTISSLTFLVFAYLGGITSVGGAAMGGVLVAGGLSAVALEQWFHVKGEYAAVFGAFGVILATVLNPSGIVGAFSETLRHLRRRLNRSRADSAAALLPAAGQLEDAQ
jgi:branched-chain amino acid transport system permease protein